MPSIIQVLNGLHVNKTTTQQIEQVENFYKKNKSLSLKDLLNDNSNDSSLNDNPIFIHLKKSLELAVSFSQNPDNAELEAIKNTIQKKIIEIGKLTALTEKMTILESLKKAQAELTGFVKQTQTIQTDERRKEAYLNAKAAIQKADIELLKNKIIKLNIKDIAELYKLINPSIIGLARFFSLKEEIFKTDKERENNLTICLDFLKDKLNLSTENITLSDLEKIPEWSKFKTSLQTKFEKSKRANAVSSALSTEQSLPHTSEESHKLHQENQQLIKEIAKLKEKIATLEIELSSAISNIEENKLIPNDNEATASNRISSSLKRQDDDRLDKLGKELQQLTAEVGTHKEQNTQQELTILNLKKDLGKFKTELETKNKQIAENLERLKQNKNKISSKEKELEKSKEQNEKLSKDLSSLSETIRKKDKSLIKTESELNTLKVEHNQIKLQIEELKSALEQTNLFNSGILKQKEEEITTLESDLGQLGTELEKAKNDISKSTTEAETKVLSLQADINKKQSKLEELENKLLKAEKESKQSKNKAEDLKRQLEARSEELSHNVSRLDSLTKQFEILNAKKEEVENKHQIQLAQYESLNEQRLQNIKDFEEALATSKGNTIHTENQTAKFKEEIHSLETNLKEEKNNLSLTTEEIAELKIERSALQDQLSSTKDEKSILSKKLNEITTVHSLFIANVTEALANISLPNNYPSFTALESHLESHKEKKIDLEEILQKVAFINNQVTEKKNAIKELQDELALKIESDEKDKKISEATPDKDSSFEESKFLSKTLENTNKKSTDRNYLEAQFDFGENSESSDEEDEEDKEFVNYSSANDLNTELDPFVLFAKQLESAQESLKDKENELAKKTAELSQLQDQLESQEKFETEIDELKKSFGKAEKNISTLNDEKENLNKNLNDAQLILQNSELEITQLKAELGQLRTNDSSNQEEISKLEEQLDALNKLKSQDKESIEKLQQRMIEKNNNVTQLEAEKKQNEKELVALNKTLETLNVALKTTKDNLSEIRAQLDQVNEALSQSQKSTTELSIDNKKLKYEIEKLQKIDSDLQKKYDTLKGTSQKKAAEIYALMNRNQEIQVQLESSKQEIEELKSKITIAEQFTQSLEQQLQELKDKENRMPSQDTPFDEKPLIDLNLNDGNKNFTEIHSIHHPSSSSSATSSPAHTPDSSSDPLIFFSNPDSLSEKDSGLAGLTSSSLNHSSNSSLNRSHSLPNLWEKPAENLEQQPLVPINGDIPMPLTQEQQQIDNLILDPEFKNHLTSALAVQLKNHYQIAFLNNNIDISQLKFTKSEINKFELLVNSTVTRLLNDADTKEEIKAALIHIVSQAEEAEKIGILSPEAAANNFLDLFKPSYNAFQADYEECCTIIKKTFDDNKTNAQQYAALLKLCGDHLLNEEAQEPAKNHIISKLKADLTAINVNPEKYREEIETIASSLVAEILNSKNILGALEKAQANNPSSNNLIDDIKQILSDQSDEKVKNTIAAYFAHIFIDHILEKINHGEMLSNDELQKIPSALQYADTEEEFITGLRVKYFYLPANFKDKLYHDTFKKLRLQLRKNALSAIKGTLPDELISDFTSEVWLEQQLQLITGKPTKLEHIELEKDQKNLLNDLDSALHLSTFYGIALTPKSRAELEAEIEESNRAQLAAAGQANELLAEIEKKQKEYLEINNDPVPGFLQKIKEETNTEILRFTPEGAKKLFNAIDAHLLNVGKWDYFNAKVFKYKLKDITNELLATIPNYDYEKDSIEKAIKYAIGFLCEKNSKDKLHKEQILKAIALFYASTKRLSTFNAEIVRRKVKIGNLSKLKDKKDREVQTTTGNSSAEYTGIFLPHNCTIIADSFDPNLEVSANSEFNMLVDTFYANNAMKVGQTITFKQKLNGGKSKEWSVTREANSFSYNTSSWVDRLKNVGNRIRNKIDPFTSSQLSTKDEAVTYAAFQHAVASNKGPVLTLSIGENCSVAKEKYIRLLIERFNQSPSVNGQKTTILIDDNDKLKIHKDAKAAMKNEIDIKNSPSKELGKAAKQSDEALNRHTTTLRGRG